ncbi:unnamed protein product [Dimorphilus gyrociliatus]|uniref:PDZ domain-containing protein n=1 Tax=Dimorphilus gyrociliatus TaxID=2664684 RepID=A0A7I8VNT6_9ANNE|nr:unnamed protein product [Dimorphilus gyrociliatus]
MSLYPSLEDMKVDQMAKAQLAQMPPQPMVASHSATEVTENYRNEASLYPSLSEYMGMEITPAMQMQVQPASNGAVSTFGNQGQVAPVTGYNAGLVRAEIKQGIRQVIACKDGNGKVGMKVKAINKGIFVAFVNKNSPAALAGIRFGDQILQINSQYVAGWDTDKCMKVLQKAPSERIEFAIRDRPFERTITMQKDSTGHIGFVFKDGKITAIVKDSSAARNGVLIDHHLIEIGGQNVVGMKDKEVSEVISHCGTTVTITIMPTFVYDHMKKCLGSGLLKKMDHSIPEV